MNGYIAHPAREGQGMIRGAGWGAIALAAVLLSIEPPAKALDSAYILHYDPTTTLLGTTEFPRPVWMAICTDEDGSQFLAAVEDPVFRLHQPRAVGVVRGIDSTGMTVSLSGAGRTAHVIRGEAIPGAPGLIFRGAVQVRSIEYRKRVIARDEKKHREGELYLVAVRGTRAIVQRDNESPVSPTRAQEQQLAALPLRQTGPHSWEVAAKDVKVAIESGEAIAVQSLRDGQVGLSLGSGVGVEVKSPLADVRADSRGFVVTSPNLASRAGLELGDRIVEVNGTPIDGVGSLVRAYLQVKNSPSFGTVRVTVERKDLPVTLTYRIR
jgi:hypothetical protein